MCNASRKLHIELYTGDNATAILHIVLEPKSRLSKKKSFLKLVIKQNIEGYYILGSDFCLASDDNTVPPLWANDRIRDVQPLSVPSLAMFGA